MERIINYLIKLQANRIIKQAGKTLPLDKITPFDILIEPLKYAGLAEGLINLPVPETITIDKNVLNVPKDMPELAKNICYGQKLFMTTSEDIDLGIILRVIEGYYFTQVRGTWNESESIEFGATIILLPAVILYPVANHINNLLKELISREDKLLSRDPSPEEKAAGIEKLSKFAELSAMNFLIEQFRETQEQVLLRPY